MYGHVSNMRFCLEIKDLLFHGLHHTTSTLLVTVCVCVCVCVYVCVCVCVCCVCVHVEGEGCVCDSMEVGRLTTLPFN